MDIRTDYAKGNYTIHVDHGILEALLTHYAEKYERVFHLVDEKVYALYNTGVLSGLEDPILLESGEASKSFEAFRHLTETLLEKGIQRHHLIIVIGGGASGDAGGFAAASVLRGVDYIHVPTTLLAHDSSIGGKTAINSAHGKNLIGAFHRPEAVIYDLDFLDTLPRAELLSGFGEVFKHALLRDEATVDALMVATREGEELGLQGLQPFIISGIETKMHYVLNDEKEAGIRKYLNLGHTLGHAIEYEYKLPHGMAVVLGLYAMMFISNSTENREIFDLDHYMDYFTALGYPMDKLKEMDEDKMIALMMKDKKNRSRQAVGFILMDHVGSCRFLEIGAGQLKQYLTNLKERL